MERIEINGVWYVREDSQSPKTLTIGENDVTHYRGIVHESDNYRFEASKLYKDFTSGQDYDGIAIEVTFKLMEGRTPLHLKERIEYWDSVSFFQGVLANHPQSINIVRDGFDEDKEGIEIFKAFLVYLQKIHWL
jgi:hypothetical protein